MLMLMQSSPKMIGCKNLGVTLDRGEGILGC